jgi:hypothetical protein
MKHENIERFNSSSRVSKFNSQFHSFFSIVTCRNDYRWVLDWIIGFIALIAHNSELQAITVLPLISTIHKSPQYPLSFFQPAVFSPAVPWQRFLTVEIQLPVLRSFLRRLSFRTVASYSLN